MRAASLPHFLEGAPASTVLTVISDVFHQCDCGTAFFGQPSDFGQLEFAVTSCGNYITLLQQPVRFGTLPPVQLDPAGRDQIRRLAPGHPES